MMRILLLLLYLISTGPAFADSCEGHPWSHALPGNLSEDKFTAITDLAKPVASSEIAQAKKMLSDEPVLAITDVQASELLKMPYHNQTAYQVYLVRGLKDNEDASLVVYRYRDKLLLESIRMQHATKAIESPQVITLDTSPSEVFISCIAAM